MDTADHAITILFVGDVVGAPGRRTLLTLLPGLRDAHAPDFVVVNGENAAGGLGITPKMAKEFFAAGVDVITLGNHTYRHRDVYPYLDEEERILRPANYLRSQPGHGSCVVERDGTRLGVINLSGSVFLNAGRPPFPEADASLYALRDKVDHVLVDMHAEATSEKVGMGWHLDGRVTAVVGTHTHVPTNDARVLPGRDRLHHRRGHDRRPRRRARRQARAGDPVDDDPDARALRDVRRRSLADGGRHPHGGHAAARGVDRAGARPRRLISAAAGSSCPRPALRSESSARRSRSRWS